MTSSTRWHIDYGAEDDFQPVDYAAGAAIVWPGSSAPPNAVVLPKDNVGFTIVTLGVYTLGVAVGDQTQAPLNNDDGTAINSLDEYSVSVLENNATGPGPTNAGDGNDNRYQFVWRCGTMETNAGGGTDMNATSMLDQDLLPGRYITNVFFDLQAY